VDKGTQKRGAHAIDRPLGVEVPSRDDTLSELLGATRHGSNLEKITLLWDHRRFLLRVMLCGFIFTTLLAFLIPKEYTSTVSLMPPDQQSGLGAAALAAFAGKAGDGMSALAGDLLGAKSSGDLFVGVLKSRTVQDNVVRKFDLRKIYRVRLWEDARKQLARNTDILQERKSQIITVSVSDRNAERAASIANQYVSELNNLVNQVSTSAAHRKRVFLEGRLKEVQQDLEDAEKEFSQFASKNTAIDIKEQAKAMVGAAATVQGELIATESELEGYRQIYTENNIRVKAAEARLAELRKQLDKLGGADGAGGPELQGKDASFYPSIRKLPLLGVTYADLYRRTKIGETVFEILTQQYELAKVEEAKDIPTVKILDTADIPEKKSFPPRFLMMVLGTLFSLLLGAVWVIANAMWLRVDQSDARKIFAQEVAATLKPKFLHGSHNGSAVEREGFLKVFRKR
jgi:uncharacterized protein involved in exopolysaccharide biosynthesis